MTNRVEALRRRQAAGEHLEFLFFWGHAGTGVGPWILSQWWPAPFLVDGVMYSTAEHWMMAEKARLFDDQETLAKILVAKSPGDAKARGREVRGFEEDEWTTRRFAIVRTGNVEKFRQHPDLCDWLLATADRVLVEASPRDTIWGIGRSARDGIVADVRTWRGENLLGFALSEVRERLRRVPAPRLPDGAVEPPWRTFPGVHPYDLHWRMGSGESHVMRFSSWWETLGADERYSVECIWPALGPWSGWYDRLEG